MWPGLGSVGNRQSGDILPVMAATGTWTAVVTQIGVGLGLFYAVVKFFDTVGDRLNEDTKLEIAVRLLDVGTGVRFAHWPETFLSIFDRVFGTRHLTLRCFFRSATASLLALLLLCSVYLTIGRLPPFYNHLLVAYGLKLHFKDKWPVILIGLLTANIFPDYISLLVSRYLLAFLRHPRSTWVIIASGVALIGAVSGIAFIGMVTTERLGVAFLSMRPHLSNWRQDELQQLMADIRIQDWSFLFKELRAARWLWFYPAYFTCVWFLALCRVRSCAPSGPPS
jgi:hypothetical protein